MSTLAIIQARLGSTRLPKKVLMRFAGHSVIEHVYKRVRAAVFHTTVACPAQDTALVRECHSLSIPVFAWDGDPEDVLGRFHACAAQYPTATILVRITADCPFVQPAHITACIALAHMHDFARLSPREGWPDGLDVEAFKPAVLDACRSQEHVTADIQPNAVVTSPQDLSAHRWTLDTRDDLAWFRRISEVVDCTPPFHPTVAELLSTIDRNENLYGHFAYPKRHPDLQQTPDARPRA